MNSSLYNLTISCYIMLYLVGGIATPLKHMTSSVGIVPTCNDGRCRPMDQGLRQLEARFQAVPNAPGRYVGCAVHVC